MKTNYSVALAAKSHKDLLGHLIRKDGQEDLCFATYLPSTGSDRNSGIIQEIILPEPGDRNVHGNVGFLSHYFERALKFASSRNEGLAFLHSHPSDGWQGMSSDDVIAEKRISPAVFSATNKPLLGLTVGTDGKWSARYWVKKPNVKRVYERRWCESVRVVGKQLQITFNDQILKSSFDSGKQLRTISAWGKQTQEDLSRLKIGIVGLGSVGSIVAEILARIGVSNFVLIDFDSVENKNLDRLTGVFKKDVGRSKVDVIKKVIKKSASAPSCKVKVLQYSICEKEGFDEALNCDVLFSCVDRPWPRQVLNFISYAHLIPVIDGGIFVRTNKMNTRILGADWKAQTIGNERTCLECLGQYKAENALLEKAGKIDDPEYIKGITGQTFFDVHENVYAFSSHLASMEVLQLLSLFIAPSGIADIGQQMHHFTTGVQDVESGNICHENCFFPTVIGKGNCSGVDPIGIHPAAENARKERALYETLNLRKRKTGANTKKLKR